MKKITFLFLCFSCMLGKVTAKNDNTKLIGQYHFVKIFNIVSCKEDGTDETTPRVKQTYLKQYFNVIAVKGDNVVFEFVDYPIDDPNILNYTFKGTSDEYKNLSVANKATSEFGDNQLYFKISIDELQNYAIKDDRIGGSLALGVINYPFKLRLQSDRKDFSGSFNFGVAVGYVFNHRETSKWTVTALSGYSISNINLDTASVNKHKADLQSSNNFTAFSASIGAVVTYNAKLQIGVFMGCDRLTRLNQLYYDWAYQGNPWFSIGFGYAIFSIENSKASDKTEQKE